MKRFIISVVILTAIVIGINHLVANQSVPIKTLPASNAELNQPVSVFVGKDYVRYPGRGGENALELLLEVTEVESTQYDFGKFIESINGTTPDSGYFWKLYVNGAGAQVGADQLETKSGDVIEWSIEQIN